MNRFQGKAIAITGGASGIGRATAKAAAEEGGAVFIGDQNEEAGHSVIREILDSGGKAEFVRLDVTNPEEIESWLHAVSDRGDGLDCLFNNAGINGPLEPLENYSLDEFQRVIDINLMGVSYGMRSAIPLMRKNGSGSIVNTGSTASMTGYATLSGYVAAKHAVLGLTKAVAREYGSIPIRVNCICPGPIETPMMTAIEKGLNPQNPEEVRTFFADTTAMKRYGKASEIASMVLFLLSDDSQYVTGGVFAIDGGATAGLG